MEEKIVIKRHDGSSEEVSLITYLNSEDSKRQYMVYYKGQEQGENKDKIIYISKLVKKEDGLYLEEVLDDTEWYDVQHLLKLIANAL